MVVTIVINLLFQSTHPVRGGTDNFLRFADNETVFQSTHPVRGGTQLLFVILLKDAISIHPPREGWDEQAGIFGIIFDISIHPPREGWDDSTR